MTNRKGQKGLTENDVKRKSELVEALRNRFKDVEKAIHEYNATVLEANEFIAEMTSIFEEYYEPLSQDWKYSDNGIAYDEFIQEWRTEIEEIPEAEDDSSKLEDLSSDCNRPNKHPKKETQFFRRKL